MSINQWRNYFRNNPSECNRWSRILRDHGYKVPQDMPALIKRANDHEFKIKISAFMMECYAWKNKATSRKNSKKTSRTKSKSKVTRRRTKSKSRTTRRRTNSKSKATRRRTNSKRKKTSKRQTRSRTKSKRRSRRKDDNRQCEPQTGTKYLNRSSPPYPANKCCGLVRQGNDGYSYISKEDKNGVCHWVKY